MSVKWWRLLLVLSGCVVSMISLTAQRIDDTALRDLQSAPSAVGYANQAVALHEAGAPGLASWAAASSLALGGPTGGYDALAPMFAGLPPELQPLTPHPVRQWWRRFSALLPGTVLFIIGLTLWTLGCLGFIWVLKQRSIATKGSWLALGMLLLGGLAALMSYTQARSLATEDVTVTQQATSLYAAPSEQSAEVRTLPVGVVAEGGEVLNGFQQVTLPSGEAGWVPMTDVRQVLSKDDATL